MSLRVLVILEVVHPLSVVIQVIPLHGRVQGLRHDSRQELRATYRKR
jgi:hypothetical protein